MATAVVPALVIWEPFSIDLVRTRWPVLDASVPTALDTL
jgi:hypothetical protein